MKRKILFMITGFIVLTIGSMRFAAAELEGAVSAVVPFDNLGDGGAAAAAVTGTSVYAQVKEVRVDKNGKGYVAFVTSLLGTLPGCTTTNFEDTYGFDVNTPGGQGVLAMMITAKSTGQLVIAGGTGACTIYTEVEDWNSGWLAN